jgi:hypothetical protein
MNAGRSPTKLATAEIRRGVRVPRWRPAAPRPTGTAEMFEPEIFA